jgi:hypothetical protein
MERPWLPGQERLMPLTMPRLWCPHLEGTADDNGLLHWLNTSDNFRAYFDEGQVVGRFSTQDGCLGSGAFGESDPGPFAVFDNVIAGDNVLFLSAPQLTDSMLRANN